MSIFASCAWCAPAVTEPRPRTCSTDRACCRDLAHLVLARDPVVVEAHVAIHACTVNHAVVCSRNDKLCVSPFCMRRPPRTTRVAILPPAIRSHVCGLTLLQMAVLAGDVAVARVLLDAGALPNKCHSPTESALVLAIAKSADEIVDLLLAHGATIDGHVLAQAAAMGSTSLVARLLALTSDAPILPALVATETDTIMQSYLLTQASSASRSQFLHHCVSTGDAAGVQRLVQAFGPGLALDYRGNEYAVGDTLVHTAVRMQHLEVLKYLVHLGVDLDARNAIGVAPVYICAATGAVAFVEVLVRAQAAVAGATGPNGDSALHVAAQENHFTIARLLVHAGADVNMPSATGDTPLHIASMHGHGPMVAYLLRKGADVHRENVRGETALMKACQLGHASVVALLERAHESPDVDDGRSSSFVYYDVMRHVQRVHSI
ncbi:ankyrin-3-like [Achlya hypogyna]|uniref:Ankyrin-3-like n=1 Tax=Achlya hypogyna TaxID=1202772 RepID=A0A1V9ZIR0_ACHHY|nr:ankyrin-3-like [Achlya hypogyna]